MGIADDSTDDCEDEEASPNPRAFANRFLELLEYLPIEDVTTVVHYLQEQRCSEAEIEKLRELTEARCSPTPLRKG